MFFLLQLIVPAEQTNVWSTTMPLCLQKNMYFLFSDAPFEQRRVQTRVLDQSILDVLWRVESLVHPIKNKGKLQ
jgi:hypothetical protein